MSSWAIVGGTTVRPSRPDRSVWRIHAFPDWAPANRTRWPTMAQVRGRWAELVTTPRSDARAVLRRRLNTNDGLVATPNIRSLSSLARSQMYWVSSSARPCGAPVVMRRTLPCPRAPNSPIKTPSGAAVVPQAPSPRASVSVRVSVQVSTSITA